MTSLEGRSSCLPSSHSGRVHSLTPEFKSSFFPPFYTLDAPCIHSWEKHCHEGTGRAHGYVGEEELPVMEGDRGVLTEDAASDRWKWGMLSGNGGMLSQNERTDMPGKEYELTWNRDRH